MRTRDLVVHYPGRRRRSPGLDAVRGVSIDIAAGRTVGLVGESGSGKSSIGAALLGLVPTAAGTISFDGADITHADRAARRLLARRMQVVFQDPFGSMNPARTIGETVTEALRYNLGLDRGVVADRLERALTDVGLPPSAAGRYPGEFSGGQRQRIAIARAIAVDPDFIVCDEAVSALDLSVQAQVLNLFARLKAERGLSYLFISHDLSVVRYLSDEIVVLFGGRVVEQGPAGTVAGRPAHPYTQALVAAAPVPDPVEQRRRRLQRIALAVAGAGTVAAPQGCAFAPRCPLATAICREEDPQLAEREQQVKVACHHYEDARGLFDGVVSTERTTHTERVEMGGT
ncbi:oligopeptide/dipeptide ABC transporter ATP-binding protein [Nakamurella sp. UYEF19]|uniref:ABC transporter ATP-binding protein n=1 Tax=Nakamurella sp. UYEF19 TaxID=1756392 RepID=UPI0033986341